MAKIGTWFLLLYQFLPISLTVTMEIVKFSQGLFMSWDIGAYTAFTYSHA